MKKNRQSGFTIVELLIVIVIIGILATIGFVSFANAQNRAKKSKAEATISQVKSKLGEYFAENNYYPVDKAAVVSYLVGNGGQTTSEEFNTANYGYTADPAACDNTATDCTSYALTADADYWNGDASEDISVAP
jgi:prepilin-type N-terminal cleavage/methylation domain-containing protein